MKNYLLMILFIFAYHKLAAWGGVSTSYYDIVKLSVQTEEENSEKKINQSNPEDHEKSLHSSGHSSLILFNKPFIYFSTLNSHIEKNIADRPFTPSDLI